MYLKHLKSVDHLVRGQLELMREVVQHQHFGSAHSALEVLQMIRGICLAHLKMHSNHIFNPHHPKKKQKKQQRTKN